MAPELRKDSKLPEMHVRGVQAHQDFTLSDVSLHTQKVIKKKYIKYSLGGS